MKLPGKQATIFMAQIERRRLLSTRRGLINLYNEFLLGGLLPSNLLH